MLLIKQKKIQSREYIFFFHSLAALTSRGFPIGPSNYKFLVKRYLEFSPLFFFIQFFFQIFFLSSKISMLCLSRSLFYSPFLLFPRSHSAIPKKIISAEPAAVRAGGSLVKFALGDSRAKSGWRMARRAANFDSLLRETMGTRCELDGKWGDQCGRITPVAARERRETGRERRTAGNSRGKPEEEFTKRAKFSYESLLSTRQLVDLSRSGFELTVNRSIRDLVESCKWISWGRESKRLACSTETAGGREWVRGSGAGWWWSTKSSWAGTKREEMKATLC